MRVGALRHKLQFQRKAAALGSFDTVAGTWEFVTEQMCELVPLSGRELEAAQQFGTEVSHEINTRWSPKLSDRKAVAAMRAVCDGRIFNIAALLDPDERRRWITLIASEGLNDG